ncbi:RpiB/LacA/LacB family sugar-phosphate isomerase [Mycoplasma zalophidermidis]|uniref:RpiB/LacA/LacB family sugar-phosphate isomerase n=1 Tax=Mycoplasma zalophidermidis TaxID=398174 RepID=A0ABS6DQV2_9MOLU|nr:RpiB/LacA/LacB family sugar-phosphate isomerase [Mycoplasma zalophidermidis]MBU4689505.1 RpiB/LacA/LacB family sugar-phosphate isomerase [Mycoplasma zalophidermidis]MBU4693383.1 RpiB/LacA/LacB family sugar-phosphate isomerase [Mycoplasma zalophidermidis]MCR8966319.1 RpiB/LacA/LacB family sugar-phosphate isomerase [Mycoplasma zalophidermidis]
MSKKIVAMASDHGGCKLKNELISYINELGYEVVDLGPADSSTSVSYSLQGHKLANYMKEHKVSFGLGFCGTGLGISYALNRHHGIRAARITSVEDAHLAKQHNNANVLVLGGRQVPLDEAKAMIKEYINTEFEGGRHQNRIDDIENF